MESVDPMSFCVHTIVTGKEYVMAQTYISCIFRKLVKAGIITGTCIFISSRPFAAQAQPAGSIPVQNVSQDAEARGTCSSVKPPLQENIVVTVTWDDDNVLSPYRQSGLQSMAESSLRPEI